MSIKNTLLKELFADSFVEIQRTPTQERLENELPNKRTTTNQTTTSARIKETNLSPSQATVAEISEIKLLKCGQQKSTHGPFVIYLDKREVNPMETNSHKIHPRKIRGMQSKPEPIKSQTNDTPARTPTLRNAAKMTKTIANIPKQIIFCAPTNLRKERFIEFIDESKYDNSDVAERHVITNNESDDSGSVMFGGKSVEFMSKWRKSNNVETQTQPKELTSIGIQTDESSEERINCGFINITKSGPERDFNLRCFYCDAEYPLQFWSEFSEHIVYNHFDLESDYAAATDEMDISDLLPQQHDNDISEDEKKNSKELLPDDFDFEESDGGDNDGNETVMCLDNYEPCEDHSYSVYSFEKIKNTFIENFNSAIDEINFRTTPKHIIYDFFDHLKGLTSLWHDRTRSPESYDTELNVLGNVITLKWGLNLRRSRLRKNLENIKTWHAGMALLKKECPLEFEEHTYIGYYNKLDEYLVYAVAGKIPRLLCEYDCNIYFFDVTSLQVHQYRQHKIGQLPYGCSKCEKRFEYVYKLIDHMKRHLPAPKENYNSKEKKEDDEALDTPLPISYTPPPATPVEKYYACFICYHQYTCENEYNLHLDLHPDGDCPYACEVCERRFRTKSEVASHKQSHHPLPYECQLCSKTCYKTSEIRIHMDEHAGNYNYVCELCGKPFVRKKCYVEHCQFVHQGYGNCKICNRDYKKRSMFYKHMTTQHRPLIGTIEELTRSRRPKKGEGRRYIHIIDPITKRRIFKCPLCDVTRATYRTIFKHVKNVHGYEATHRGRRKLPERENSPKLTKKHRIHPSRSSKNKVIDNAAVLLEEAAAAISSIPEEKCTNENTVNHTNNYNNVPCSSGSEIREAMINVVDDDEHVKVKKNLPGMSLAKFFAELETDNILGDVYSNVFECE